MEVYAVPSSHLMELKLFHCVWSSYSRDNPIFQVSCLDILRAGKGFPCRDPHPRALIFHTWQSVDQPQPTWGPVSEAISKSCHAILWSWFLPPGEKISAPAQVFMACRTCLELSGIVIDRQCRKSLHEVTRITALSEFTLTAAAEISGPEFELIERDLGQLKRSKQKFS